MENRQLILPPHPSILPRRIYPRRVPESSLVFHVEDFVNWPMMARVIGQRPTGVAIVTRGKKEGREGRGRVRRNTLRMFLISFSPSTTAPSSPPTFFPFPSTPPWKEKSGDLIAFGSGPGHEQSCSRSLSVGHSYPSRKVRLFHPVDTRELVTRLVVNFVPSGTGVGKAGGFGSFFFPSFFRLRYFFLPLPILPRDCSVLSRPQ